jgi:hypothetical protein
MLTTGNVSETGFNMPDNDVSATVITRPINYTILYNNIDGATMEENPTKYNVETPDFTLNNPVKTGYIFGGWT